MGTATGNSPPWQCRETASVRFSPLQLFNSYVIPKSAVAYSDSNGRGGRGTPKTRGTKIIQKCVDFISVQKSRYYNYSHVPVLSHIHVCIYVGRLCRCVYRYAWSICWKSGTPTTVDLWTDFFGDTLAMRY